jgi:NAD(P)-dependent dehydrogenase (short-subunit alcohol dehydrogenase family)
VFGSVLSFLKESDDRRRVVLITGASTGLGLALVKELSHNGKFHVIATARRSSVH